MRNMEPKNYRFVASLNILGLLGIVLTLYIAFYYQLVYYELPCPLCLLQRVSLAAAGIGFLFNIYRGVRYSHYSLIILSALITGAVAVRQIFLHILPGDPGYGMTFLGLHFYTWVFITAVLLIFAVFFMIILTETTRYAVRLPSLYSSKSLVTTLFVLVLVGNVLSTLLECGLRECPSDPEHYILLSK